MAWRKVALGEDENLYCDISDEDIQVAAQDLRNQLLKAMTRRNWKCWPQEALNWKKQLAC